MTVAGTPPIETCASFSANPSSEVKCPGAAAGSAVNEPAHNLYVCPTDSAALRDHLVFRDYLRTHPDTADAYATLKRDLARQFQDDVDLYARSKTNFIAAVLEGAGISRARIDHIRRENGL